MGQPEAASGIWDGQSRRSSRGLSEAVGQPTSPAGTTYAARQNELKTLKALAPRPDEFLRKTEGTRCDFASCGTPVIRHVHAAWCSMRPDYLVDFNANRFSPKTSRTASKYFIPLTVSGSRLVGLVFLCW